MQQPIEVGLVGFGMAGRVFHAPLIDSEKSLHLKKVVERHGQSAKQFYPWVGIVTSFDELLADQEIDLVVIATPNKLHYDMARQALLAGKHVVVDKPFAVTSREADDLIELAASRQRLLSVFQSRRWDGDFCTVRKLLDSGVLGRIVNYEAHYNRFISALRPNTWKEENGPGSGILYDLGSHLIDQALVLFGYPRAVTCHLAIERDGGKIIDSMDVILWYPEHKAVLRAGMLVREQSPHYVVHGTCGSYVKYGLDVQEEALKQGHRPQSVNSLWGHEPEKNWGKINTEVNGLHYIGKIETLPGCYQSFYRNIADHLINGCDLEVKAEEARDVVRIIEYAGQSHLEGKTIVLG